MARTNLEQQLAAVHAALERTDTVDAQTRELLVLILSDISRLLGVDVREEQPLTERLESLAVQFEADHPAVGTAVRQLVDALAKAGI